MTKTTCCLAFTAKSPQPLRVGSDFGRKYFDGDAVAEQDVPCAIDGSHSAFSQQRFHLVLAVEHSVDDGSRVSLEDLAINRTEAHAVVVFRFAGSAVFHPGLVYATKATKSTNELTAFVCLCAFCG